MDGALMGALLVRVLTKVVGKFFFPLFLSPNLNFCFGTFFLLTPYPNFFPSKTFPPPACSHLFIPLTPIHLLTYTFKI